MNDKRQPASPPGPPPQVYGYQQYPQQQPAKPPKRRRIFLWVAADVILGLSYIVYRLSTRNR
jgi:hypothetical protein